MPYFHNISPRITAAFVRARSCGDYYLGYLHAAWYYGVILYLKIKAASFCVRARDYDFCNKPISIGLADTMAALRRRISTLRYIQKKGVCPSLLSLILFYSCVQERVKPFDEFANRAGRNDHCARFSLISLPVRRPVCLYTCPRSPRTRRRPPAGSLAWNNWISLNLSPR